MSCYPVCMGTKRWDWHSSRFPSDHIIIVEGTDNNTTSNHLPTTATVYYGRWKLCSSSELVMINGLSSLTLFEIYCRRRQNLLFWTLSTKNVWLRPLTVISRPTDLQNNIVYPPSWWRESDVIRNFTEGWSTLMKRKAIHDPPKLTIWIHRLEHYTVLQSYTWVRQVDEGNPPSFRTSIKAEPFYWYASLKLRDEVN